MCNRDALRLVPAIQLSRPNLNDSLKEGGAVVGFIAAGCVSC